MLYTILFYNKANNNIIILQFTKKICYLKSLKNIENELSFILNSLLKKFMSKN